MRLPTRPASRAGRRSTTCAARPICPWPTIIAHRRGYQRTRLCCVGRRLARLCPIGYHADPRRAWATRGSAGAVVARPGETKPAPLRGGHPEGELQFAFFVSFTRRNAMYDLIYKRKRLVQFVLGLITLPFAFVGVGYYFRNGDRSGEVATVAGSKITD